MDRYIATTYTGLEPILAKELIHLGANDVRQQKRGVAFTGTPRIMYRANFECRTALKILMELHTFRLSEAKSLYEAALGIPWERYIPAGKTFVIETDVFSSFFDNTMYAALLCKDGVVDRIRSVRGDRPSVDKKNPDIEIQVHIRENRGSILLNSSGKSLHIRSYKKYPGLAPLSEVLAAGLIGLSGWDQQQTLINPMCGSGTILIEALRLARNIPAQIDRHSFSFKHWPDFHEERWDLILKGAKMRMTHDSPPIIGFDNNPKAVAGTKTNTASAGGFRVIQVYQHDFFQYEPKAEKATCIINPPYNVRLPLNDQRRFYNRINNMLYTHYKQYDNWILCPKEISLKRAGFRVEKEITVFNGPIECRFAQLSFQSKRTTAPSWKTDSKYSKQGKSGRPPKK